MTSVIYILAACFAADFATPWEQPYVDGEANGPNVLGLWKFDDDRGIDATGRLAPGELKGGRLAANGKFGGALESFAASPEIDESHGFVVPNNPRLSPTGAFTIELWINPKAEFAKGEWAVLVDKKFAGNSDYQLAMSAADAKQQRRLTLSLGFGSDSQTFLSDSGAFNSNEWVHLAATYDGRGTVRFFRNGKSIGGSEAPGRGAISAGNLSLSIGDRMGRTFHGFPGFIDEVRLTSGLREFGSVHVSAEFPRSTFVRFEPAAKWNLIVSNLRKQPIDGVTVEIAIGDAKPNRYQAPTLAVGEKRVIEQTFDTTLRPDAYQVTVSVGVGNDGSSPDVRETYPMNLIRRPQPVRMPVVMWGIGGVKGVLAELPRLKRIGFTHCFGGAVDHQRIVEATEPTLVAAPPDLAAARQMLDTALANDLRILAELIPVKFEPYLKDDQQVGRDGRPPKSHCLNPNSPGVMQVFERAGESIGMTYADHPAFEGICVNSEIRDDSDLSFSAWDVAAYRKAFGASASIPTWAKSKNPPNYTTLKDFPADRVVTDKDPRLAFYRWWWSIGDGWNSAHSAVHRGFHRASSRPDLWTFFDPAVRCPPIWGSGGDVDVLSHWTYTSPEPVRIGLPADELFAMAAGRKSPPRVMKMTQLIWYRSTTAPVAATPPGGDSPATWVDKDPTASYISIHPLHLREAFWTKIARPVDGIMFHGWPSLVPTDGTAHYKYTNPQLQDELTRLIHDVVEPLGPTLRQVPAVKSDVAFLESFTSFVFATRGTFHNSSGPQADLYLALQYAGLQPGVVYEEHVMRDGLDGFKLLVLADCDVLPRPIVDKILAFQKRGGMILGDTRLCPAIKADITVPVIVRKNNATSDKEALLTAAKQVRSKLDGKYLFAGETSSPDVVLHRRRAGASDYIFLVNDAREPGNYVGQYGLVNEHGLPTAAEVRLESNATAIYDLVEHQAIPFQRKGKLSAIPVSLGPGDGRLLMTVPRPIARLSIDGPAKASRGAPWSGKISVEDDRGQRVDAVVPLHVEIFDADGRLAEFSGYYGAAAGMLDLKLDIASNDVLGIWEIRVHDLASGQRASSFFRVAR